MTSFKLKSKALISSIFVYLKHKQTKLTFNLRLFLIYSKMFFLLPLNEMKKLNNFCL
jgi:hypothetical protein